MVGGWDVKLISPSRTLLRNSSASVVFPIPPSPYIRQYFASSLSLIHSVSSPISLLLPINISVCLVGMLLYIEVGFPLNDASLIENFSSLSELIFSKIEFSSRSMVLSSGLSLSKV